ncbi:unnamed protein product [Urochloa humidicola]
MHNTESPPPRSPMDAAHDPAPPFSPLSSDAVLSPHFPPARCTFPSPPRPPHPPPRSPPRRPMACSASPHLHLICELAHSHLVRVFLCRLKSSSPTSPLFALKVIESSGGGLGTHGCASPVPGACWWRRTGALTAGREDWRRHGTISPLGRNAVVGGAGCAVGSSHRQLGRRRG